MDAMNMIRMVQKKITDTAKVIKARQVSLDHFPVPDPGHRRAARAPMCIR